MLAGCCLRPVGCTAFLPVISCGSACVGGRTPRRVLLTGFCVGGSLANIAACWAGLQSPTSDVRCITFGAPNCGKVFPRTRVLSS